MNKLGLIIQREYLSRVTRKSFILATILTPLAFALFFVVVGFIFEYESDESQQIAIIDEGNIFKGVIKDEGNMYFEFVDMPLETLRANFEDYEYDGILRIPKIEDMLATRLTIYYYSDNQPTLELETSIRSKVADNLREYKIASLQLDKAQLDALDMRVELDPEPLSDEGSDATSLTSAIAAGIGSIMGLIMYFTVFIYGMMVMRSVMEEKTSRIVEVMISSVRPFHLMLGKIIGVGAVGLTQVVIWAILIPLVMMVVNLFFNFEPPAMGDPALPNMNPDDMQAQIGLAMQELSKQNWWLILPLFLIFFLGGYFLYASLFAAVGSAMGDDIGEGQSLTLPITIPVILAFYIMMVSVQSPNSSLAVWSSLFPLFSPIVMPARLAFNPPFWEVALSVVLLVGTCVFFVWLSGRIYRVGILMYGKKVTLKELGKWMFYKD
jgi:ABC-2 type transport system permease protein